MQKWQKLLEYLKKKWREKFGAKKSEEEGEEEIGSFSMNEGQTEKVFGINRTMIKFIGGFFVAVFVTAVIFAATGNSDDKKMAKVEELKEVSENDIADGDRVKNNLPSDYESFVAMTQAKNQPAEQNKTQMQSKSEEKPVEVQTPTTQTQTPVLPRTSYPEIILPRQQSQTVPQVQMPKIETQETANKATEKNKEREKYSAPIAFSSFNSQAEKSSESTVEEKTPTKVSYKKNNLDGISAGTIISARLMTGINSEVEGQVTAQILSDVYNTGRTKLLIPQGSKVVGTYKKSEVSHDRVPIEFEKIILTDGGTMEVGKNLVAVDGAGYTGIKGKVHHHTAKKISAGVMGAAIAAMGSAAAGNSSSGNNNYSAGELAKQGAMANMMNVTSKMFEDAAKIENTVTVEPGYEFQIYVKEDLEF